jgi:hypothetical protein
VFEVVLSLKPEALAALSTRQISPCTILKEIEDVLEVKVQDCKSGWGELHVYEQSLLQRQFTQGGLAA